MGDALYIWRMVVTDDGFKLYVNDSNSWVQWTDPRFAQTLPENWERLENINDQLFYYNRLTGATFLQHPLLHTGSDSESSINVTIPRDLSSYLQTSSALPATSSRIVPNGSRIIPSSSLPCLERRQLSSNIWPQTPKTMGAAVPPHGNLCLAHPSAEYGTFYRNVPVNVDREMSQPTFLPVLTDSGYGSSKAPNTFTDTTHSNLLSQSTGKIPDWLCEYYNGKLKDIDFRQFKADALQIIDNQLLELYRNDIRKHLEEYRERVNELDQIRPYLEAREISRHSLSVPDIPVEAPLLNQRGTSEHHIYANELILNSSQPPLPPRARRIEGEKSGEYMNV